MQHCVNLVAKLFKILHQTDFGVFQQPSCPTPLDLFPSLCSFCMRTVIHLPFTSSLCSSLMMMDPMTSEVTSMSSNQSTEICGRDTTVENMFFGAYYILVFFMALNGNSMALWIFSRQRGVSTPTNVFLMHLAVADLSYAVIIPLRATYHLTGGHWPFGELPCRLAGFLFYVNMYASLYFLACVAGDRYLAVVHAVRSIKVRRARYAHFVSFSLWTLVLISMVPLLASRQTSEVDGSTVCLQLYREKASHRALISLGVAFTPPFLVTLSCYLLIVHSLQRGSRLDPALRLRALRTVSLVLLIYVLCFLPYHASRATYILGYSHPSVSCYARRGLMLGNRLTSSLTCLNGALDPLVYLLGAEKFRDSLKRIFYGNGTEASAAATGELKGTNKSSMSAKSELSREPLRLH
ncbi:uracil nucleotide/cysteinyl leukotriene receptor-like [Arapaima gigas]